MSGQGNSFQFWLRLYRDMIGLRKKAFIYTYELDRPHLGRIYSVAKPKLIYKGKTPKLSGNTNEDWNVIEMATMSNIYLAPLRSPSFLLKRLLLLILMMGVQKEILVSWVGFPGGLLSPLLKKLFLKLK